MRKDYPVKPWLFPQPVLIIGTFDDKGHPNAMNAAWGGTYDHDKVIIALSKHKSTENLKLNKAFSLSFATKKTAASSDFVGIVSANNDPKKMEKSKLTFIKSEKINAPLFNEYPLTLECVVDRYDEKEEFVIGKVVNVSVDESIIKDGKIDTEKLEALVFDPINIKYRLVGEVIADAFKVGFTLK